MKTFPLRRVLMFLVLLIGLSSFVSSMAAASKTWHAGVARVGITPESSLWMAGDASRTRPAEGKHAELWARVLALKDECGEEAVLVSLDLIGIDRRLSQQLHQRLHDQFALARAQVMICCSHTHTGPVVGKCLEPLHYRQLDLPQQELIDQYEREGRRTWVAAYTNDVMAYIPSERVLRQGGYEGSGAMVYYGLPTDWAPGVEQKIVRGVPQ